jgi:CheY-like chemotaxis protein
MGGEGEAASGAVLIWQTLLGQLGTLVWAAVVLAVAFRFAPELRRLLPGLRSLKGPGFALEFEQAREALATASDKSAEQAVVESTLDKSHVRITSRDQKRALARAQARRSVLEGRRILWVDDQPQNTRLERQMLRPFGLDIEPATSSDQALLALAPDGGGYDLIISDIARDGDMTAGITFARALLARPWRLPLVFYVFTLDIEKGVPPGAMGITNRPDELLHLVIDALERRV